MEYRFELDCTARFKNGGYPEVRVLHWFTSEGHVKAVVAVIRADGDTNPRFGEVLKVDMADLRYLEGI